MGVEWAPGREMRKMGDMGGSGSLKRESLGAPNGRVWEPQAGESGSLKRECLGAPNGSPKLEFEIEKALNGRWERNAISAIWGAPR